MNRLIALFVALGVFALAAPAFAHVTVSSPDATPGGYGVMTVRVPTESDTASTTKVDLSLPVATPFAQVLVQPKVGWTHTVVETKLAKPITNDDGDQITSAITEVIWTATAGGIKPGEFDDFTLDVGPFANASSMTFSAIQTYSNGMVVKWNETAAPGSTTEPDHPAPVLTLSTAVTPLPAVTSSASSKDGTARTLAVLALALAAAGLGFAVVNRARGTKSE